MKRKTDKGPAAEAAPAPDAVIQRAKQELERMIDLNPQIMLLVDRAGTVIRANRSLMALLGLHEFSEVLGRPLASLFAGADPAFFQGLPAGANGYLAKETRLTLAEGRERDLKFAIISSADAAAPRVVIVNDITEEHLQAQSLEEAHKKAAAKALLGAVMHNVNQPLTVITVRAKLMLMALEKNQVQPEELRSTLTDIMDRAIQVAETLKKIERVPSFRTEPYVSGTEIMDIT